MNNDITNTLVEIRLPEDDSFLKIKETLTRIGVSSRKENKLFQSCHILHKKGKYYIVHFKEMFKLDGKTSNFDENDKARRNRIIKLLEEWNLLTVVDPNQISDPIAPMNQIKVIRHDDRENWTLETKYNIGGKRSDK